MADCNNCSSTTNVPDPSTRKLVNRRRSTDMLFSRGLIIMTISLSLFNTGLFFFVADYIVNSKQKLNSVHLIALERLYESTGGNLEEAEDAPPVPVVVIPVKK